MGRRQPAVCQGYFHPVGMAATYNIDISMNKTVEGAHTKWTQHAAGITLQLVVSKGLYTAVYRLCDNLCWTCKQGSGLRPIQIENQHQKENYGKENDGDGGDDEWWWYDDDDDDDDLSHLAKADGRKSYAKAV